MRIIDIYLWEVGDLLVNVMKRGGVVVGGSSAQVRGCGTARWRCNFLRPTFPFSSARLPCTRDGKWAEGKCGGTWYVQVKDSMSLKVT